MAKNSITDFSATAASNTDIQNVDIDEGCAPSGINNAIRELMADLADVNAGTVALTSPDFTAFSVGGTTITATAAELNFVDGVTSNIQTQLDAKGTASSLSDLGVTATSSELNVLDGFTGDLNDINIVDVTTLGTSQASKAVTADANGVVTFDNGVVGDSTAISSSSGSLTINCRDGNDFTLTLSENITSITISNPPSSGRDYTFSLKVTQDASASGYTIAWPSSVDWPNGTAPTLTSTANAVDYFLFTTTDGGTTFYGFTMGKDLS